MGLRGDGVHDDGGFVGVLGSREASQTLDV
jgi:hypothetical protein